MTRNLFCLSLFGLLIACDGGDDSGKIDTTDETTDGEDGATGDSCWLVDGLCVETNGDTAGWCDAMQSVYAGVLDNITYSAEPCPGDAVGSCTVGADGDYEEVGGGTSYYYAPEFDASLAQEYCNEAMGTFQ